MKKLYSLSIGNGLIVEAEGDHAGVKSLVCITASVPAYPRTLQSVIRTYTKLQKVQEGVSTLGGMNLQYQNSVMMTMLLLKQLKR